MTVVRGGIRRLDRCAPLFILGAPRSGTSLLYKALCLHPDVGYISNWMRRAPRVPSLAVVNRLAPRFPRFRRSVWFGIDSANAYVYGERRPLHERLFPMPVEGEPVFRFCGLVPGLPTGLPDPAQIACVQKTFTTLRRYAGARLVVSKRIANNQRIPVLAAAFPGARFVHLIRDGRAVAFSLSQVAWWDADVVWWLGASPVQWREQGGDPWELRARHWVRELEAVDQGLLDVPADQQLQICYEDLVEHPLASLDQVAAFAGLPGDAAWTTEIGRLRYPNRNQRWREGLPSEVLTRVESIQYEHLRRLGYVV